MLLGAVADGQVRKVLLGMQVGPGGAVWVSAWCRRIMRAMEISCEVEGEVPTADERGLALVSNHLSYLDILVYSAVRPFVMVSKTEVRGWPLLGWITAQAGTVYVERADVKGGQRQTHAEVNARMSAAFESGLPVLFFPEGTTTDGGNVLPFRRGLFHSVVNGGVPMRTAAVAYSLGEGNGQATVAKDVCYWGEMVFGQHLFGALGLKDLKVRLKFGETEVVGQDRFELAMNARDGVCDLYEGVAEVASVPRQVAFPSQQREYLFDRPVEGFAPVDLERGVRG